MTQEITTALFEQEVLKSDKPVVIDFYAQWCGPCKMMAPLFNELATELADQYKLVKIDVDNERDLAISHRISSIPTIVFYKNGEVVGSQAGYMDKEQLKEKIAQYF